MKLDLSEVFYFLKNSVELEKGINGVLNKYHLDHQYTMLFTDDEFFRIEDMKDNRLITGLLKSPIRRTHRFVDVVNILFQYYLLFNNSTVNTYQFIRDISKVILTKTDVKNFHYERLLKDTHPAVIFYLINIPFYMEITESKIANDIKMISVYNMNQEDIDEFDRALFTPVIKNKALKSTGDSYISLLYQMMLYVHYHFSFIKGTSAWNNI